MAATELDKLRNVGILGQGGSGKTSLGEAMLFAAGAKRVMLPFHGAADLCTPDDARRLLDQRISASGWESAPT